MIGLGSMGSAALYYLSGTGAKVIGIEQFDSLHEKGSYSGYTRIIRKAYFEHPDYVPLLHSAYNEWYNLEEKCSENFFHQTGLLYIDSENGPIGNGVLTSSELYDLPVQKIGLAEAKVDYPYFVYDSFSRILLEKNAGFLDVEKAITSFQKLAVRNGAKCLFNSPVRTWGQKSGEINVELFNGTCLVTKKLIICSGAYTDLLTPAQHLPLNVTNQLLIWIETFLTEKEERELPCWTYCTPGDNRIYYGFPSFAKKGSPGGLKIAYHSPGQKINPLNHTDTPNKEDMKRIHHFMETYMPGVFKKITYTKNCLYTNTPDENFLLDYLPDTDNQVVIATGFSGHGFKFVPAIGKIIANLILDQPLEINIDFFSFNRF